MIPFSSSKLSAPDERSTKQQEAMRRAIWRIMDSNHTSLGSSERGLASLLKKIGLSESKFGGDAAFESQICEAVQYFAKKGLIEDVSKPADKGNRRWRILTLDNNRQNL